MRLSALRPPHLGWGEAEAPAGGRTGKDPGCGRDAKASAPADHASTQQSMTKLKRTNAKRSAIAKNRGAVGDAAPPANAEAFRHEVTRRMLSFIGTWRTCAQPLCKRARACRGQILTCMQNFPRSSPQRTARMMAKMHRLIRQRLAEIGNDDAADSAKYRLK